jgi:hypothetical protein
MFEMSSASYLEKRKGARLISLIIRLQDCQIILRSELFSLKIKLNRNSIPEEQFRFIQLTNTLIDIEERINNAEEEIYNFIENDCKDIDFFYESFPKIKDFSVTCDILFHLESKIKKEV